MIPCSLDFLYSELTLFTTETEKVHRFTAMQIKSLVFLITDRFKPSEFNRHLLLGYRWVYLWITV